MPRHHTANGLAAGGQPPGGLNFTADYVGGSFVTVTAVPEPTTLAIHAAAGCLAAIRRYRA